MQEEEEDADCAPPAIPELDEKLDILVNARKAWSEFVREQTLSIASQLQIPLAQPV